MFLYLNNYLEAMSQNKIQVDENTKIRQTEGALRRYLDEVKLAMGSHLVV